MARSLIVPLAKRTLVKLIKEYGIQLDLFDRSRLVFAWEGLEYRFYRSDYDDTLLLDSIVVRMDVVVKFQKGVL